MAASHATLAVMVFLSGLLPASCHKDKPASNSQSAAATNSVSSKLLQRKLGELTLTNLSDTYVQFDNGEICTLTPKLVGKDQVCFTFAVESKNEHGETREFTVKQVTVKTGSPVEVAIGDLNLSLTPKVVKAD